MTDFQSMLFVNVVQSNQIGLPYLFHLKQPSKYATPSIFSNFLTTKSNDCSVHLLCRVLNRGKTTASIPGRKKQCNLSFL